MNFISKYESFRVGYMFGKINDQDVDTYGIWGYTISDIEDLFLILSDDYGFDIGIVFYLQTKTKKFYEVSKKILSYKPIPSMSININLTDKIANKFINFTLPQKVMYDDYFNKVAMLVEEVKPKIRNIMKNIKGYVAETDFDYIIIAPNSVDDISEVEESICDITLNKII